MCHQLVPTRPSTASGSRLFFSSLLLLGSVTLTACGDGTADDDAAAAADSAAAAAAAAAEPDPDIWLMRIQEEDGALTLVEPRNFSSRPGYDNQPHFTASGELLYVQQEGDRTDLWRWDPATDLKNRVTLTPDESEYSPTPIPGGEGAVSYIKVEADSTQRLWRVEGDGEGAEVLLPEIAPVGYHAWIDENLVAIYVLGEPATMQIVDVRTGEARTVAEGIGRSPQAVPGRRAVSFTRPGETGVMVERYDIDADRITEIAPLPTGAEFHAWTPDGVLLTGSYGRIAAWRNGDWVDLGDLSMLGLRFSRLAVSPDGAWLAVVAEPTTR